MEQPTLPWRVLVIDDDADTRANLGDILELDGLDVAAAESIAAAMAALERRPVEMILLDRQLPDGRAEEALPRLRALAPEASIVIVTGFADMDGVINALRERADDYLFKPVKPQLLRQTLARLRERQVLAIEKRRTETAFRALVESAGCLIVSLDSDGRIVYFNPFAAELTGWSAAEVLGGSFFDLFVPAGEQSLRRDLLAEVFATGSIVHHEDEIRRRDGRTARVLWNARRLDGAGDRPVVLAIGQDITALAEAQERALRVERLAAIGQMVTGLAHESRNALQRSQACLEMLALDLRDRPVARDLLERIQAAQDDLHRLFEEVRFYAAPIQLDRRRCCLADIWREAWEQVAPQRAGRDVVLRDRTEAVAACCVDRFRLVQVFRNLFENSLAACPDPVVIEIECRSEPHEAASGRARQVRDAVRVAVRDNGPGLEPEVRRRLFEPFFTTKSQGTGLGLAIASRIVTAHDGTIKAAAGACPGAEIVMTIPCDAACGS
jgi:two-component system sensor kinase FixL